MKKFLLIVILLLPFATVLSQQESGGKNQVARIYGKVKDSKTNKSIEASSVQLFMLAKQGDSLALKDSLVGGMLTRKNGDFNLENLPSADSLKVYITAIGYSPVSRIVALRQTSGDKIKLVDLGNIMLEKDATLLQAIVIKAETPGLQMGIDRRVFNVEKSIVSTGGTAVDVMKNIPSVTVSVDGTVELRGNTPQIFVDGLPTILTLDQIPADNIEKIELITNPSAKFDASSGGGIINVVLKKNKKSGLNGIVSAGAGVRDIFNGNLTLNLRQGRFNFFTSGNFNQNGGLATSESFRQNKTNGVVDDYFTQYSTSDRLRRFGSLRFGMDFFVDNRNTLSISQNFVKGRITSVEDQDQHYYNTADELQRTGKRYSDWRTDFNRANSELTYRHIFIDPGDELTVRASYNTGTRDQASLIINDYFLPNGTPDGSSNIVRNDGDNDNKQFTFQSDYVNTIGKEGKLEAGVRGFFNDYNSVFDAFSITSGGESKLPLSNHYRYKEKIYAAYATYGNQWKTWRYQLGLRAEYSDFDGELVDSAKKFGYQYPDGWANLFNALFPSLYLTKVLNEKQELQFNYSRRIRRPNFWQLNPFIDIQDPFNIRQGNPELQPEFINSFEVNYTTRYNNGNIIAALFWRNNPKDITQYSDTITSEQYQLLNNAAIDPNAIVNTFINADVTNRYGAELTIQHKVGRNIEITPTANVQYRKVIAAFNSANLDNEGFNWEGKLIMNYKTGDRMPAWLQQMNMQVIGEYESGRVIPQGRTKSEYSVDMAWRKDFWKDKRASLTFAVNDVFNTLRFGTIYDTENFYQDSYRRWNVRTFRLTFTYKFGNSDFKLFRRNESRDGDDNGMRGGGE